MSFKPLLKALVVSTMLGFVFATPAHAVIPATQGTWESTLLGRDINLNAVAATSDAAVYLYDTTLKVTWLRDVNATESMDWATAMGWADNLSTGAGTTAVSDWRLPMMTTGSASCGVGNTCDFNVDPGSSELASLYHATLGNVSVVRDDDYNLVSGGLTNTGSFKNFLAHDYWMSTVDADYPNDAAWSFNTLDGAQGPTFKAIPVFSAIAVRSGDVLVTAVPEPETYAMLIAGLALVAGVARKRRGTKA